MFSKACEYGIRAVIFIAERSLQEKKVSLREIANSIASPAAFTSKILQQLSRNNIIHADKGPKGGFSMDERQLDKVRLSNIVTAIDGDDVYKGCGLGLKECNEKMPCPVHDQFKSVRNDLKEMLEKTSARALANGLKDGLTFLKR